jgi:hypothetical protein
MRLLPLAGGANGEIAVRGAVALIRWLAACLTALPRTNAQMHKISSGRQRRPPCSRAAVRWDDGAMEMMPPRILLAEGAREGKNTLRERK